VEPFLAVFAQRSPWSGLSRRLCPLSSGHFGRCARHKLRTLNPPELIESARVSDCVYNSGSDMPILAIWEYTMQARCLGLVFGFAAQSASRSVVKFREKRA